MYKLLIIALFVASFATAQTKKPSAAGSKTAKPVAKDTAKKESDVVKEIPAPLPKEFAVYTKRSKVKGEKMKLCINLVSRDSIFNYCINDSLCRDPEVAKILYENKSGDSTYVLIYVRAFSKPEDKPSCDAGKEVKLFFVRWNTKTNKSIVKIKTVESCMRGITNMAPNSVDEWDKTSPLIFSYHRGAQNYVDLKFDPQQYLLGFQSNSDN